MTDTVQLPKVYLGWLTPNAFAEGDAEMELAAQILGGGKSSRLYRKLVYEQQIAQEATCYHQSLALGSPFACEIIAKPNVKPEDIEKAASAEIDALGRERSDGCGVGARTQYARGEQDPQPRTPRRFGGKADMLNYYNQYLGDPGYLPKDIARYDAVTTASIQKYAKSTLGHNQRVVIDCMPGKKGRQRRTAQPGRHRCRGKDRSRAHRAVRNCRSLARDRAQAWAAAEAGTAGAHRTQSRQRTEGFPGGRPQPAAGGHSF